MTFSLSNGEVLTCEPFLGLCVLIGMSGLLLVFGALGFNGSGLKTCLYLRLSVLMTEKF